jgi:amino acid transporter
LPLWLWAAVVVALFTLVASGSVRESVSVAAGITAIEIGGLLLVIAAGAPAFSELPQRWPDLIPGGAAAWGGCLAGAFVAFFAYSGFETMVNMAEETRNAARTVPRAILASIVLAGVLYTAAVLAVLLTVPPDRLAASATPLSLVLPETGWSSAPVIVAFATIATSNGVLVEILMASRLLYGMAHRGWAPHGLARIAERTGTPLRATLIVGGSALGLAVVAPIEALAEATQHAAVASVRHREPGARAVAASLSRPGRFPCAALGSADRLRYVPAAYPRADLGVIYASARSSA